MVQPTPWRLNASGAAGTETPAAPEPRSTQRVAEIRARLAPLRGRWGYVCAAIGGFFTLILMFQPWLMATGPNGKASATPFGRIDAATQYMDVWSSAGPSKTAKINGVLGILAAAAIIVTISAVVIYLRTRSEAMAKAATIGSVAVAILVVVTLLYMNSKGAELKNMTVRKWDIGGQVGSLMGWAFGNSDLMLPGIRETQYVASATLTPPAMIAIAASLASAVAAVAQWIQSQGTRLVLRLSWPVVILRPKNQEEQKDQKDQKPGQQSTPDDSPGPETSS
ncbi:hypothetical protein [Nocardia donostiensis]|uniref:Uncharacterized protein n=1 Tax=Nocardia donostiensis TaxID=1538463 RepID=A0A1W0ARY9_9NOCA|nr:hypothetical protein [Nocardia donostiensis]ONM48813.1 hypothetical protein B0T46_10000 [Nocardia donostiensis]OQS12987.1 hypothetical protein B0T36_21955 [Nocardia donostiensis]OQS22932.1 hypothetical protein B0T44_04465 [Nocardia donostiensis]